MRRSSFITWDQLKVGVLILVALTILGIAILKLGQAGNLFGRRYLLTSFVGNASGLRVANEVRGEYLCVIRLADSLPGRAQSVECSDERRRQRARNHREDDNAHDEFHKRNA